MAIDRGRTNRRFAARHRFPAPRQPDGASNAGGAAAAPSLLGTASRHLHCATDSLGKKVNYTVDHRRGHENRYRRLLEEAEIQRSPTRSYRGCLGVDDLVETDSACLLAQPPPSVWPPHDGRPDDDFAFSDS